MFVHAAVPFNLKAVSAVEAGCSENWMVKRCCILSDWDAGRHRDRQYQRY